MPISKENRARYPDNWKEVSNYIRFERADGRCECEGECGHDHGGRCEARHGLKHPVTGSIVVLTTAHRNHQPEDCAEDNLFAGCQRCHLAHDRDHHAASRKANKEARAEAERQRIRDKAGQLAFEVACFGPAVRA